MTAEVIAFPLLTSQGCFEENVKYSGTAYHAPFYGVLGILSTS